MNKIFNFLILFLFISNCSLDTKTGLWSQSEKLSSENENVEEKLFQDIEIYEKEFNTDLKIRLKNNFKKNSFVKNLLNNNGVIEFIVHCISFYEFNYDLFVGWSFGINDTISCILCWISSSSSCIYYRWNIRICYINCNCDMFNNMYTRLSIMS